MIFYTSALAGTLASNFFHERYPSATAEIESAQQQLCNQNKAINNGHLAESINQNKQITVIQSGIEIECILHWGMVVIIKFNQL